MRVRGVALFVAVGAGYVLGYELADHWFSAEDQHASFFPAAGVTLAALVLLPRRDWLTVLAAAASAEFLLDVSNGTAVAPTLGYVLANAMEPLLGAALLTAVVAQVDLRRIRDLTAFLGCAVVVAPVIGGVIAATTFVYVDGNSGWARFAFEWWSGDSLGVLVVGGAILSLRSLPELPPRRVVECFVLAGATIAVTAAVFQFGWFEFIYLPVALLVVLAFRAGTTGVAVTGALVAFVAAGATAEAKDFWASVDVSPANRILYLQLALGVVLATLLALAAEIAERERIAVDLARAESERAAAQERGKLAKREQRARIQAESLARSAATLARTATVEQVAEGAVAILAKWGASMVTFYLRERDHLSLVAATGVDESFENELGTMSLELEAPTAEAARLGVPAIAQDGEDFDRRYPSLAALRARYGLRTFAAFPVSVDGTVRAVLVARSDQAQWLTPDREELFSALADQVGVALQRAMLRAEAEEAAADAALLAHLGEVLERAIDMRDRAVALVRALTGERAAMAVVHSLDGSEPPRVLARGSSDIRADALDASLLDGVAAAALDANGPTRAQAGPFELLAVPLRARDRILGVLTMGVPFEGPTRLTGVLIQRVATRAALAFDNALLYEQERDVSHSLQMGLLGKDLSPARNAVIATAYRPGSAALEVGGDWYDAFTLADDRLAILVGDVVGHGLEAAVAMGQLRGAVRALAPTGPPHAVLEGLDVFVEQLPAAAMATLAYVELNTSNGRFAYACAGHPPPLVVAADGTPRLLWEGRSTPLGSSFARGREEALDRLEPGDVIVLYSDGLVERRTEGISAGIDALLDVTRTASGARPRELVDAILGGLLEQEQDDDVCVLALRLVEAESRFEHEFLATPGEVAWMRRRLAEWLEDADIEPERRHEVVLAVAEAGANAAEHAYDFDGKGVVRVEAWISNGNLQISIEDSGKWHRPRLDGDRGRGIPIMNGLMRDVTIDRGPGGTTVRMRVAAREEVPA